MLSKLMKKLHKGYNKHNDDARPLKPQKDVDYCVRPIPKMPHPGLHLLGP